jgi:hypothetical protein
MNFGESRLDTLANRFRTADRPEVHKKQARLLGEHVAMERRHQDIAPLQLGQDRVYLVRNEHEVASCGDVAGIRCLKIDGLPDACGGGMVIPAIVMVSLRGTPYDSSPPLNVPLRPTASSTVFTQAGGAGSSAAAAGFSSGVFETARAVCSDVASCDAEPCAI